MTGHRPFSELIKDWPPERRQRVEEGTARLSAEVEAAMAAERAGKRAQQGPKAPRASAEAWERRQSKQGKPTQSYR